MDLLIVQLLLAVAVAVDIIGIGTITMVDMAVEQLVKLVKRIMDITQPIVVKVEHRLLVVQVPTKEVLQVH